MAGVSSKETGYSSQHIIRNNHNECGDGLNAKECIDRVYRNICNTDRDTRSAWTSSIYECVRT